MVTPVITAVLAVAGIEWPFHCHESASGCRMADKSKCSMRARLVQVAAPAQYAPQGTGGGSLGAGGAYGGASAYAPQQPPPPPSSQGGYGGSAYGQGQVCNEKENPRPFKQAVSAASPVRVGRSVCSWWAHLSPS